MGLTELNLYKYITENEVEYHWHGEEVYLLVNVLDIKSFNELLPNTIYDDGLKCTMKDGYIAFEMQHICDYSGIELKNIFKKERE